MCRLGIGSEQTSDTHQLAAAAASVGHRPRSSSLLQRSPPTGLAKKNSGDAASRACRKRKPMQAGAVSDADSMHWRFFGSRGRPKVALRKAGAVSDADSMHSRPSGRGCGRSATPLGPASGQRRRCITQKNPARPSAPTRHTRQRIKPSMCRLGIGSEQTSDTHQLAAAPASSRHRPRSSSLLQRSAANRIGKKEQRRRRLARAWEAQTYASRRRFRCRSMHWRFFGSRGRVRRANLRNAEHFQM